MRPRLPFLVLFYQIISYYNKLKNRRLVNEVIDIDILVLNHKYKFKQPDFALNKNNSFSEIGYSETDTRNDDHLNCLFEKNEQTTTSNSQQVSDGIEVDNSDTEAAINANDVDSTIEPTENESLRISSALIAMFFTGHFTQQAFKVVCDTIN